jgi:hypothetical protein
MFNSLSASQLILYRVAHTRLSIASGVSYLFVSGRLFELTRFFKVELTRFLKVELTRFLKVKLTRFFKVELTRFLKCEFNSFFKS